MTEADKQKALELARKVIDYVGSRVAKDIGSCQEGTFCYNAGIVARALVECLEPVEVITTERNTGVCPCGKYNLYVDDKFCPNCGSPIRWVK